MKNEVLKRAMSWQHGVKVEPGPRDPGPHKPGTLDLEPPTKFKSGTPGLPKSGSPSPFFNELISFRMFGRFFTYLFLCLF